MKQPPTEPRPPMMMTMNTEHQQFAAHRGVDLLAIERPQHAADPGERRAGHEHADEQPVDAVAERLDHFAVLDPGADQQADLGAVEHQHQADEDDEADQRRDDAVFLDRRVAEQERAAEARRRRERDHVGAEQGVEQLLGDDRAADRHQDLLQMLAVDRHDHQPLEHEAERAADDDRRGEREREQRQIERPANWPAPSSPAAANTSVAT